MIIRIQGLSIQNAVLHDTISFKRTMDVQCAMNVTRIIISMLRVDVHWTPNDLTNDITHVHVCLQNSKWPFSQMFYSTQQDKRKQ